MSARRVRFAQLTPFTQVTDLGTFTSSSGTNTANVQDGSNDTYIQSNAFGAQFVMSTPSLFTLGVGEYIESVYVIWTQAFPDYGIAQVPGDTYSLHPYLLTISSSLENDFAAVSLSLDGVQPVGSSSLGTIYGNTKILTSIPRSSKNNTDASRQPWTTGIINAGLTLTFQDPISPEYFADGTFTALKFCGLQIWVKLVSHNYWNGGGISAGMPKKHVVAGYPRFEVPSGPYLQPPVLSPTATSGVGLNSPFFIGGLPDYVQVKVFDPAVWATNGFDPSASPCLYDSGPTPYRGGPTFYVPSQFSSPYPTPGIMMTRWGNSAKHLAYDVEWNNWAGGILGTFTAGAIPTGLTQPAQSAPSAPLLTAAVDAGNNRVVLTLQHQENLVDAFYHLCPSASPFLGTPSSTLMPFPVAGASTTVAITGNIFPPSLKHRGARSWQLTRTSTTGTAAAYCGSAAVATGTVNGMPVTAGKTYAVQASALTAVTARSFRVNVDWYTAANASISTSTGVATGTDATTWTTISGTVTAPATAAYAVVWLEFLSCVANEVHYFDGVVFRPYSASGLTAATEVGSGYVSRNMLQTIGADSPLSTVTAQQKILSGTPNLTFTLNDTTAPHTGTTHLKVVRSNNGSVDTFELFDNVYTWLPENVVPNTSVTISAWARASTASHAGVAIGVEWYDKDMQLLDYTMGSSSGVLGTTYVQISCSDIIPNDALFYKIIVSLGRNATTTDTYYFDDFMMSQTASVVPYQMAQGATNLVECPLYWYIVERSIDGGSTWAVCAYGSFDWYAQTATAYDYFMPYGLNAQYRARTYGSSFLFSVSSAYSATQTVTQSATGMSRWVIQDPLQNGAMVPLQVDFNGDQDFKRTQVQDTATYNPLGRSRVVVLADQARGIHIETPNIDSIDGTELTALKALMLTQHPFFLIRPWTGEIWMLRIVGDLSVSEANTNPIRYTIGLSLEEVDVFSLLAV